MNKNKLISDQVIITFESFGMDLYWSVVLSLEFAIQAIQAMEASEDKTCLKVLLLSGSLHRQRAELMLSMVALTTSAKLRRPLAKLRLQQMVQNTRTALTRWWWMEWGFSRRLSTRKRNLSSMAQMLEKVSEWWPTASSVETLLLSTL